MIAATAWHQFRRPRFLAQYGVLHERVQISQPCPLSDPTLYFLQFHFDSLPRLNAFVLLRFSGNRPPLYNGAKVQGRRHCGSVFREMDILGSYNRCVYGLFSCIIHRPVPSLPQDRAECILCRPIQCPFTLVTRFLTVRKKGYPQEWFPSVSSTIGDRYPERSVFQLFIAITSGMRLQQCSPPQKLTLSRR